MTDREKIICMAMDAFRLCIGGETRNFTHAEIVRYINNRAATSDNGDG